MKKILPFAMALLAIAATACTKGDKPDSDPAVEPGTNPEPDPEPQVVVKTISFEECEFEENKADNLAGQSNEGTYEEFGATFAHYNYYGMIGGVIVCSKAEIANDSDEYRGTPDITKVAGDEKAEKSGADGTGKFAIFSYYSYVAQRDASFSFAEGVAHKILSAKVNNSARSYQYLKYGYYSYRGLADGEYCEVVFTGYDAAQEETGSVPFLLADFRDGKEYFCSEWTEVDLSALGEVNKVGVTLKIHGDTSKIYLKETDFSIGVDEIKFELPAE